MSTARTNLIRLGAISMAAAALLGAASAAGAAPPSSSSAGNSDSDAVPASLAGIKAKATTDITDRVNDLNAAIARVNAANALGSGQAALVAYLGTDVTPLQQLDQKIGGDATVQ